MSLKSSADQIDWVKPSGYLRQVPTSYSRHAVFSPLYSSAPLMMISGRACQTLAGRERKNTGKPGRLEKIICVCACFRRVSSASVLLLEDWSDDDRTQKHEGACRQGRVMLHVRYIQTCVDERDNR